MIGEPLAAYRRHRTPDPLDGFTADQRALLLAASTSMILPLDNPRRYFAQCKPDQFYSSALVCALMARGLLVRAGERLELTGRGRSLARIIRHRAEVRAIYERPRR